MENKFGVRFKHLIFYLCMTLFWGTLALKNLVGLNIPVFIFLIYTIIVSLICDRDEMIALAASCIPFSSSLQYRYILLIIAGIYIFRFYSDFKKTKLWAIFGLFIVIWEGIHFATFGFSIIEYLRGFAELVFCIVVFSSEHRAYDFSLIRRTLAISTAVVCSIMVLDMVLQGLSIDSFFSGYYRFGQSIGDSAEGYGGTFNPNRLGFICNLSIVGLLQCIYAKESKLIDYILIPILAFYGLITFSRSFLLCLGLIAIIFMISRSKSFWKTIRNIAILGIGTGLSYMLFVNFFPNAYKMLLSRWEVEDITNGRLDLLTFFNAHIVSSFSNLFFGIGMQNVPEKLFALYGEDLPPHNGIQEILVIWGLPGIVLVICWVWLFIKGAKSYNSKMTLINFLPLILIFVYIQSGQFFRSGAVMLSIPLAFISLCQKIIKPKNIGFETEFLS